MAQQAIPRNVTLTRQGWFERNRSSIVRHGVINLFNLIDDRLGIVEEVPFTYKRRVVGAGYDPAGNGGAGQYVYVFNGNTVAGLPVVADDTQSSRWQAKVGIRIRF